MQCMHEARKPLRSQLESALRLIALRLQPADLLWPKKARVSAATWLGRAFVASGAPR